MLADTFLAFLISLRLPASEILFVSFNLVKRVLRQQEQSIYFVVHVHIGKILKHTIEHKLNKRVRITNVNQIFNIYYNTRNK